MSPPSRLGAITKSIKSKSDSLARLFAELFRRAANDASAEASIKTKRPHVLRKSPNQKRTIAVIGKIFLRGFKHPPPEADALKFRRKIKLKNLAAIGERRHAVAAIACIAGDAVIKVEHEKTRAARDGVAPPYRPAASDHPFEFSAGNNAPIGVPPRRVMDFRDLGFIARSRSSYCDESLDHKRDVRATGHR